MEPGRTTPAALRPAWRSLAAAAARGWRLADVRTAAVSGAWKGLPGLYHRASEPGRMDRLLPLEWRKSVAFVAGEKNVRHWLTSDSNHAPLQASTALMSSG